MRRVKVIVDADSPREAVELTEQHWREWEPYEDVTEPEKEHCRVYMSAGALTHKSKPADDTSQPMRVAGGWIDRLF